MSLLSVDSLRIRLGGQPVVDGVSFHIGDGEVLALLGPSGCGKTTTLRAIAGLQVADEGSIRLDGDELSGAGHVPPERRGVGLVFQDGAVFPHRSVRQNLAFGLRSDPDGRVDELVELLGLSGLQDRMPHQLSGGQRQRVALGRALAPRPRLLLLDEPFASLDAALKASLRADLFGLLRKLGMAALLVTHDQDEALELADRVAVMHAGQLEQVAAPRTLLDAPANAFVAEFVGGASLLPVAVADGRVRVLGREFATSRADGPARAVLQADRLGWGAGGAAGELVGRRMRGGRLLSRVRLAGGVDADVPGPPGESVVATADLPLVD